ncbi:MAG: GTPase ObgE [Bacteroidota bacterium]|nr:GTPase ObgE [Bacteroidota bacterium]
MSNPNFIDYVKIFCRSGKGGAGSRHFRREKFEPKGGPDGGDGGRGGHIILKGSKHRWTLLHLKYNKHHFAGNGAPGGSAQKSGVTGKDIVIEVPPGTIVRNAETGEKLLEILEDGQEEILLEGGKGGLGNTHFKSSTNQSPRYAQPGIPAQESWVILELKVLADVGLVGFPNAGKSTLLASISAAKPKVADYPFTTITPNLGIVSYRNGKSFVMADIPGIIEGASEGKGLGLRFLRHIERNSMLLFMIPADTNSISQEYDVLLNELKKHNPELLDKSRLLAVTKSDLLDKELEGMLLKDIPDVDHVFISSIAQTGIETMKDNIWKKLNQ